MKKTILALTGICIACTAVSAQDQSKKPITRQEFEALWGGQFDFLDKSGVQDGQLNQTEWKTNAQVFGDYDTDKSGLVDKKEWLNARFVDFDGKDKDKDGVLTPEEQ